MEAAVSSTLDFWLTLGSEGSAMEKELASFLGVRHSLLVNSGSSANLVAMAALTSAKLPDKKRIKPGDEVITVAAGFPTTVAPIVQVGAVPVFIDADPITGNARCDQLEAAYSQGKTKAVMMAHALGNPFDLAKTLAFCKKYDLWLVEDNCDALGCSYSMPRSMAESLGITENSPGLDEGPDRVIRWTGTWGDISTQSFYPPHHLTMGEGGAVNIVRNQKLKVVAESFRDWGRDCWCPSGIDNTCNKCFGWQLGDYQRATTTSTHIATLASTSSHLIHKLPLAASNFGVYPSSSKQESKTGKFFDADYQNIVMFSSSLCLPTPLTGILILASPGTTQDAGQIALGLASRLQ